MPENPTLAEYDARTADAEAAEPQPDPRVVALQALVDAETARQTAGWRLDAAQRDSKKAGDALDAARKAYNDAMRGTQL